MINLLPYDCGFISAFIDNNSLEENKKSHKELLSVLLGRGYQTTTYNIKNRYIIKVVDIKNKKTLKQDLIYAGNKLNQKNIIFAYHNQSFFNITLNGTNIIVIENERDYEKVKGEENLNSSHQLYNNNTRMYLSIMAKRFFADDHI